MKYLLSLMLFLNTALANGALPITAESLREFALVAQTPAVYEAFGPYLTIKSIENQGNGIYVVTAGTCTAKVKVELDPNAQIMPGPRPIIATVVENYCLP